MVGNKRWLMRNGVKFPFLLPTSTAAQGNSLDQLTKADEIEGRTVVHVAIDGRLVALVSIWDPIKPEAALTVAALRHQGLHVALLTGDNIRTACAIAKKVFIPLDILCLLTSSRNELNCIAMRSVHSL